MATSGTSSYNETRDQIVSEALMLLQVLAAGETVTTNDLTYCAAALNRMVKAWMAQGIHLWTEEEGTLYLVSGQAMYTLPGANGSDGSGTPVETSLSTAGSGTSINVVSSVGMSINDNIGIVLDNNTVQWTTITSITNNTIGLNNALTSSANLGNNLVYTYTTSMPRPLSIQSARVRNLTGFDKMIEIKPRLDYMNIPEKNGIIGSPIILYYTPQVSAGNVYLWPCPANVTDRIKFTYLRTIQDFDNPGDNPDLPQEWLECLTFNLAVRIAPAYGINLSSGGISGNPDIIRMAAQYLSDLEAWDSEQPYIQLIPKYQPRR